MESYSYADYIDVDLFCGGGGWSEGYRMAMGRDVDIAINHDRAAIIMHEANHPHTVHLRNDVTRVNPRQATRGRKVGALHLSPDCTHFSNAKGGKPREQFIRDLAWVGIRWVEETRPVLLTLENVKEFLTWGPLDADGKPIKERAGDTFRAWVRRLRRLGYRVEWRVLLACDFGAPTKRERLFIIARRDGKPIVWPKPTHGDPKNDAVKAGKLLPWRTAAECIDLAKPGRSIFDRKKPLALNTQRRIAEGIRRYVLGSAEPFIVCCNHSGDFRGQSLADPFATVTKRHGFGVVSPWIQHIQHSKNGAGVMAGNVPLCTVTAWPRGGGLALGSVNLIKMRGQNVGQHAAAPLATISAQGTHHALASCIIKYYGKSDANGMREPLHTLTGRDHMGYATAIMDILPTGRYEQTREWLRQWGVIGAEAEAELVVNGERYRIVDICLRMLEPRELFRCQGFSDDYDIAPMVDGKPLIKAEQVAKCGNSVCPQWPMAILRCNGRHTWAVPQKQPAMPLVHACGMAV